MKKSNWMRWGGTFFISVILLFLFASRTSPLYSLLLGDYGNNTASAAMMIGKSWAEGKAIPYRDLFLIGGPLYFLIQSIGWVIAGRTGIFILEVISFAVFLRLLMRLMELFISGKAEMLILGVCICSYVALFSAGNSSFEWCLPYITGGCIIALDQERTAPYQDVSLLGVLCGCVLLTDFRAGGLLYGATLWRVIYNAKEETSHKIFLKHLCYCFLGIAIPIFIAVYAFGRVGAGQEMLAGTFYYPMLTLFSGFNDVQIVLHKAVKCLLLLPLFIAGIAQIRQEIHHSFKSRGMCMLFSSVTCSLFLLNGDNRWYYYLAALPAIAIGIAFFASKTDRRYRLSAGMWALFIFSLIVVPLKNYSSFLTNGVLDVVNEFYVDAQEYQIENPEYCYLALDTDCSYFLLLNQTPQYRYFANQTELSSYSPAIAHEIKGYLDEGDAEIVFITERGYIGRQFSNYKLTQVYIKYGGSLFVYIQK